MNLENLGLVELNAQEVQEIDGGLFGYIDILVGVGLVIIGGVIADWDDFKKGITGH